MKDEEPAANESSGPTDAQDETVPKEEYDQLLREHQRLVTRYNDLADALFEIEEKIELLTEDDELLQEAREDVRSDLLERMDEWESDP